MLIQPRASHHWTPDGQECVPVARVSRTPTRLWWGLLMTMTLMPLFGQAAETITTAVGSSPTQRVSAATGPTLRLHYEPGKAGGNPVEAFMYFVPLISPEAVSIVSSPGSTQSARVTSAKRRFTEHSLLTTCEFEFSGEGSQQNHFDLTNQIRRQERKLKEGRAMRRQLSCITVEGPGSGTVEVEGTISNGVQVVTEVRLRFNARGKSSPVSIDLCDIRYEDNEFRRVNEMVARVNTLTFRRKPGPPRMEVTVASVKKKGAGKNLWQSITGGIKGAAVNAFIDPLRVEATGHRAMLEFGQALVLGASTFTFPRARNLKNPAVGPP
jgi:hypothetical protein